MSTDDPHAEATPLVTLGLPEPSHPLLGGKRPFGNTSAIEMLQNLAQVSGQLDIFLQPEVIPEYNIAVKRAEIAPMLILNFFFPQIKN